MLYIRISINAHKVFSNKDYTFLNLFSIHYDGYIELWLYFWTGYIVSVPFSQIPTEDGMFVVGMGLNSYGDLLIKTQHRCSTWCECPFPKVKVIFFRLISIFEAVITKGYLDEQDVFMWTIHGYTFIYLHTYLAGMPISLEEEVMRRFNYFEMTTRWERHDRMNGRCYFSYCKTLCIPTKYK